MEATLSTYDEQAFSRLCDKLIEVESGCYEYQGAIVDGGYGFFWYKNQNKYAHRMAWFFCHGEIPAGLNVLHTCDNRRCCNVDHLFLGTSQDNTDDMIAKGRQVITYGEARSKLKEEAVRSIKQELKTGATSTQLAHKYGTTPRNIRWIRNGVTWGHI